MNATVFHSGIWFHPRHDCQDQSVYGERGAERLAIEHYLEPYCAEGRIFGTLDGAREARREFLEGPRTLRRGNADFYFITDAKKTQTSPGLKKAVDSAASLEAAGVHGEDPGLRTLADHPLPIHENIEKIHARSQGPNASAQPQERGIAARGVYDTLSAAALSAGAPS
jgi:hypothetical protein